MDNSRNYLMNCRLNPNTRDEPQPASPSGLDREVWPTREFVRRPMSIAHDFTPEAKKREGDETSSHITGMKKNADQRVPRSMQIEQLLGCAYRATIVLNAEGIPFVLMPRETKDQSDVVSLYS